jgi:hypothetical protein
MIPYGEDLIDVNQTQLAERRKKKSKSFLRYLVNLEAPTDFSI